VSARVAALEPGDNGALLELARACSTGSDAFRVERSPDFFALGRQLGSARYFGARDDRGGLLASVGVTRQQRHMAGALHALDYVHDLRVHPAWRGRRVASRLLAFVAEALRDEVRWCFASVLGENPELARLVRGFVPGFEEVRALGRTLHVGVPLFTRAQPARAEVVAIDRDTFSTYYARWGRPRCLAPADAYWERARGGYFAVIEGTGPVAVYKLVDERAARRFVATRGPSFLARALAFTRGRRGAAGLPRGGAELPVHYAAFHASCDGRPHLAAIADHARRTCGDLSPYLFLGLGSTALEGEPLPLGSVCFASLHVGFGALPAGVRMDFHELTLI
jgi:GNAT superfamily N-acetyltransferase